MTHRFVHPQQPIFEIMSSAGACSERRMLRKGPCPKILKRFLSRSGKVVGKVFGEVSFLKQDGFYSVLLIVSRSCRGAHAAEMRHRRNAPPPKYTGSRAEALAETGRGGGRGHCINPRGIVRGKVQRRAGEITIARKEHYNDIVFCLKRFIRNSPKCKGKDEHPRVSLYFSALYLMSLYFCGAGPLRRGTPAARDPCGAVRGRRGALGRTFEYSARGPVL